MDSYKSLLKGLFICEKFDEGKKIWEEYKMKVGMENRSLNLYNNIFENLLEMDKGELLDEFF